MTRRLINHQPIAEGLQALPGAWGLVGDYVWRRAALGVIHKIRTGSYPSYQPAGAFEAELRYASDGDALVYARYIGTTEVAA